MSPNPQALAKAEPSAFLTPERIQIVRNSIAPDLSPAEFAHFIDVASTLRLDPLRKQIYAIKTGGRVAHIVGIDGFRTTAMRTGALDGHQGPFWAGPDGQWREVWLEKTPPAAAMIRVFRKGHSNPYTGIATYESYCKRDRGGKPTGNWATMADVMIAKCAESLALRKAFPDDLAGVYSPEEMDQATRDPAPVEVYAPPPTNLADAMRANTPDDHPVVVQAVREPEPEPPSGEQQALMSMPDAAFNRRMYKGSGGIPAAQPAPSPQPTPAANNERRYRFGLSKGLLIAQAPAEHYEWYVKALRENIANPDKARFLNSNQAELAAVEAAWAAKHGTPPQQEFADDDIPF